MNFAALTCPKVLIVLQRPEEAAFLDMAISALGARTLVCSGSAAGREAIHSWQPDLLIADATIDRAQGLSGLRLAEECKSLSEQLPGNFGIRVLVRIHSQGWDHIRQARRTGAHVVVASGDFDAEIRYFETVVDNLKTDRICGPALYGIHRYSGQTVDHSCAHCEWVGATVSFGSSEADVRSAPVRLAILNALMLRRRGLTAEGIVEMINARKVSRSILGDRKLKASSVKMEMTRLREDLGKALGMMGSPFAGSHFLPVVDYGARAYRLEGSWQLLHIPPI